VDGIDDRLPGGAVGAGPGGLVKEERTGLDPLPLEVRAVLDDGRFCHLAVRTGRRLHLTPMVYAVHSSALWVTTARRTVKARAWRTDPRVAGLVRGRDRSVAFVGTVRIHDLLDPATWPESVARALTITLAALAFTRRNARFFAGYAVDARRVPLAWTPPGRVFAEIRLDAAALIADTGEPVLWNWPATGLRSRSSFRRGSARGELVPPMPAGVRALVDRPGPAALALDGASGPVVLPAEWVREGAEVYAALTEEAARLARAGPEARAALTIERASRWRAGAMTGLILQGTATLHALGRLRTGRRSAEELARRAGLLTERAVVVRVRPERAVWWKGWSSGSARLR
jgi:nitroimidazol reductase NimA-like FMN-containing flavoprotein (pyridoxamine 5'-phosphate oxidase superfamily)